MNPLPLLATTSLITLCTTFAAHAQAGEVDPFAVDPNAAPAKHAPPPNPVLSVCFETFSLSISDAAALMRTNPGDAALYDTLVGKVADNSAIQESLTVLRCLSGQKATNESITEYIYPTEWEPPELPNAVGVQISGSIPGTEPPADNAPDTDQLTDAPRIDELPELMTPATACSFETRNAGVTLEIEPVRADNSDLISLRIAPEIVKLAKINDWGQGVSNVQMPEIDSQRVNTSAIVRAGLPHLLGTMNPSPASAIAADPKRQVWFAFVTVSPVNE